MKIIINFEIREKTIYSYSHQVVKFKSRIFQFHYSRNLKILIFTSCGPTLATLNQAKGFLRWRQRIRLPRQSLAVVVMVTSLWYSLLRKCFGEGWTRAFPGLYHCVRMYLFYHTLQYYYTEMFCARVSKRA